MASSGLDLINEMAKKKSTSSNLKKETKNLGLKPTEDKLIDERKPISFKKMKIRKVFKGSHLPESLAIRIEEKAQFDGISESFLIKNIIEDWFNKYG